MKKVAIGVGLLLLLAAIVGMNLRRSAEKAVQVEVATVSRKNLVARVSGSGRVAARKSVSITSRVVGKVLEVLAAEGDFVEKGQLLLRIDPGERTAAMEQARANLARAEARADLADAEFQQAEFELRRARGLVAGGLASEQDLEAAQTSFDVRAARVAEAREEVRNARAGVRHAEYELSKTEIHAEIPGVIVRLSVEEGENVLAGDLYNAGSPIVVIADLAEIEAQILVDETEVVKVRTGQSAEVTVDAFPDLEIPGRVLEVGNSAYNAGPLGSQEAKDFLVRILLDEVPSDLRPGLSARAEIVTDRREDVLAVPIEALTIRDPRKEKAKLEDRRGGRSRRGSGREDDEEDGEKEPGEVEGVFLIRDDRAVFTEVKTGIAGKKDFEVVSGLSENDRIVRGPFQAIRDLGSGQKVKFRKEKKRGRRSRDEEKEPDHPSEDA